MPLTLPEPFIRRINSDLPTDATRFLQALEQPASVSIRINDTKLAATLPHPLSWNPHGYQLSSRPSFSFDPLLHAGAYYVQEASSMFLHQIITQHITHPVAYLDLCAAPGGKSTLALQSLPKGSIVIANEYVRSRAMILAENITKWGNPNAIVINESPARIGELTHLFDVIAADVPCSGEGMFRKDPEAITQWSQTLVEQCAARQRDIISHVWQALKPGGLLIYSTCTYNRAENEETLQYIIDTLDATIIPISSPFDTDEHPILHFYPHLTCGEGFTVALLRKSDADEYHPITPPRQRSTKGGKPTAKKTTNNDAIRSWIHPDTNLSITTTDEHITATPTPWKELTEILLEHFRPLTHGTRLAELRGNDFVPTHALALSTILRRGAFPETEVSYTDAITFLRRESITLPDDTPRGYILITYRHLPLGWVKNIGQRSNNLYPNEWRIRSSYLPDIPPLSNQF